MAEETPKKPSSNLRYNELKYKGEKYTEQWKIDEILIKNKFNWMVNAEIANARLEIFQDTLVWNAGIWYNGDWYFGVWRAGEWKYGTWQNGVWYDGIWRDGTFKSGIIYNGKFHKGKILKGEIRGGQFTDIQISPEVVEYTGEETQTKTKEMQQALTVPAAQVQAQPQSLTSVRVTGTPPANQQNMTQPRIQQEKMKIVINYDQFIKENIFGKNKGDDFANKLMDIIENEKIEINYDNSIDAKHSGWEGSYNVTVDGEEYYFSNVSTIAGFVPEYIIVIDGKRLPISRKVFRRLKKIYKNQDESFPDLSDLGRSTKKYNL